MATNPAYVYQRRVLRSFARLAEPVAFTRPLAGGSTQEVDARPLIVPAAATLTTSGGGSSSGGGGAGTGGAIGGGASPAVDADQMQYDGLAADVLAGSGAVLTLPPANSAGTTSSVVPALILGQDVFQTPVAVGDTFTRDGHGYTVRSVADQITAGVVIAVLSVATKT